MRNTRKSESGKADGSVRLIVTNVEFRGKNVLQYAKNRRVCVCVIARYLPIDGDSFGR